MPLKEGYSKKTIFKNIAELTRAKKKRSPEQIKRIAFEKARASMK